MKGGKKGGILFNYILIYIFFQKKLRCFWRKKARITLQLIGTGKAFLNWTLVAQIKDQQLTNGAPKIKKALYSK